MDSELYSRLGNIEAKVEILLSRTDQIAQDHERRIAKLEKWQGKLMGGIALTAFVVGILARFFLQR